MPDSLPPIPGPASYDERDLDSLLSGEAGYPTVILGPVAGVLDALRGAPAPDELEGEAAARAAYRQLGLPGAGSPAGVPAGPRHRRVRQVRARHVRARRPLPSPRRWQVMAVAGSAAAAVIIGVAALAGAFSALGGHQGTAGPRTATQAAAGTNGGHATSPVLEGGGSSVASARPTRRAGTPQPAAGYGAADSPEALCRQYMSNYTQPGQSVNWQQLSRLAGGPSRIHDFCVRQLGAAGPGADPDHQGGSGFQQGRGR
jgi:hypothetical protein